MSKRPFVALDRDGTIIAERHYLADPDLVELLPGAASGLWKLRRLGLGLVVITNQSAIGRGYFDENLLHLTHQRMLKLLAAEGVELDGIYFCPHKPEDDCRCRKPQSGLLELAAKELGFDLPACFVIGDKPSDIEMGRRVGATTFLVRSGYGAQVVAEGSANPDYVVNSLVDAAQVIERLLPTGQRKATTEAGS